MNPTPKTIAFRSIKKSGKRGSNVWIRDTLDVEEAALRALTEARSLYGPAASVELWIVAGSVVEHSRPLRFCVDVRSFLYSLRKIVSDTYEKEGGLFWISNDAAVPLDVFTSAGLRVTKKHKEAYRKDTEESLRQYREARASMSEEAREEERREARAAFGPGASVYNVLTGEKIL